MISSSDILGLHSIGLMCNKRLVGSLCFLKAHILAFPEMLSDPCFRLLASVIACSTDSVVFLLDDNVELDLRGVITLAGLHVFYVYLPLRILTRARVHV
jgi:hypothetical protein